MSYLKAALIVFVIFAIPAMFVLPDRVAVAAQYEPASAVVESCKSRKSARVSRASHRARSAGWGYAPVALTQGGIKAYGTLYLSDKKSCTRQVGEQVRVFINPETGEGRINSFLQFWLFPWLILGAASFVFFSLIRQEKFAVFAFLGTGASTTILWMIETGTLF